MIIWQTVLMLSFQESKTIFQSLEVKFKEIYCFLYEAHLKSSKFHSERRAIGGHFYCDMLTLLMKLEKSKLVFLDL